MGESEEKPSFKVLDRRRFDSEGNEKGSGGEGQAKMDSPQASPSQGGATVSPQAERGSTKANVRAGAGEGAVGSRELGGAKEANAMAAEELSVSFSSFVISLATQSLMQMGQMPPPDGMSIPPDLEAAKQTIDILAMLQIKTKGNLDAEEARMMEEVLHSLRLAFVQKMKK